MSNHIHLVVRQSPREKCQHFCVTLKKFTSKEMLKDLAALPESRREWLMHKFSFEAKRSGRAENYKIWKDSNHAVDLTHIDIMQKINYIHNNPVNAGLVSQSDHYLYSSAIDYSGGKGLVNVVVV